MAEQNNGDHERVSVFSTYALRLVADAMNARLIEIRGRPYVVTAVSGDTAVLPELIPVEEVNQKTDQSEA